MFERFTDRARRVLVLAQEESRMLGHNFIGTEHLVLGLIQEEEGVAARVLASKGITLQAARRQVQNRVGPSTGPPGGSPPFTADAKRALDLSLREALHLGHDYIGPEHLLLGIIIEASSTGAQVLVDLGGDLAELRERVISRVSEPGEPHAEAVAPQSAGLTRPAADAIAAARQLAGQGPVGTHHLLVAVLAQQGSLGAKVLDTFGVTALATQQLVDALGVASTTDEAPEVTGGRTIRVSVVDHREPARTGRRPRTGRRRSTGRHPRTTGVQTIPRLPCRTTERRPSRDRPGRDSSCFAASHMTVAGTKKRHGSSAPFVRPMRRETPTTAGGRQPVVHNEDAPVAGHQVGPVVSTVMPNAWHSRAGPRHRSRSASGWIWPRPRAPRIAATPATGASRPEEHRLADPVGGRTPRWRTSASRR